MNELIVANDNCSNCGVELPAAVNFCSHCGMQASHASLTAEQADVLSRPQQVPAAVQPIVIVPPAQMSIVDEALNNRMIVVGILLLAGPVGLPALWFSRRFSKRAKVITTVVYFFITAVLPLVAVWYFLETSLQPLLDVISR